MANPLLDRVRPAELADRGQVVEYQGVVGDFGRLVEIVEGELAALAESECPRGWRQRPVAVRLAFRWLDARRDYPAIDGSVAAPLAAVCQRCLEGFELPLATTFSILFADDDAADATPGYECYPLDDGTVRLLDLVEESLVMAMPLAPVHASANACGMLAAQMPTVGDDSVKPFAGLREQMDKGKT